MSFFNFPKCANLLIERFLESLKRDFCLKFINVQGK